MRRQSSILWDLSSGWTACQATQLWMAAAATVVVKQ